MFGIVRGRVGGKGAKTTISVSSGTFLNVIGSHGAVIDGGNQVQLFMVSSGFLYLSDLILENGCMNSGGTIQALSFYVMVVDCNLTSNVATEFGGAIPMVNTTLILGAQTISGEILLVLREGLSGQNSHPCV